MPCNVRIQTGSVEPIEVIALDAIGAPLLDATDILVQVRRVSDGLYLDWSDDTFKASPVSLTQAMVEVNQTNSPGEYHLNTAPHISGIDTGSITNPVADDTYQITVSQNGGTASNMPQIGEIKVGQFVDDIPDFDHFERAEIKQVLGITGTGTPNDAPTSGALAIALGLMQHNFFLDETVYSPAGLMTSGRIRIFPSKLATDTATDGGAGEGELAVFRVASVAEPAPLDMQPTTYRMTRE